MPAAVDRHARAAEHHEHGSRPRTTPRCPCHDQLRFDAVDRADPRRRTPGSRCSTPPTRWWSGSRGGWSRCTPCRATDLVATLTPVPDAGAADAGCRRSSARRGSSWHFHDGRVVHRSASATRPSRRPASSRPTRTSAAGWSSSGRRSTGSRRTTPVTGHPHDPFKRLDVLPSSRHVVVSLGGTVLADTTRAVALYETQLPVRWYVPRGRRTPGPADPERRHLGVRLQGSGDVLLAGLRRRRGRDRHRLDLRRPAARGRGGARTTCASTPSAPTSRVDGVEVPRPDTLWRSRRSAGLA